MLKPGMFVKTRGARDASTFRRIVEVNEDTLLVDHYYWKKTRVNGALKHMATRMSHSSDVGKNKVTKIFEVDSDLCFVKEVKYDHELYLETERRLKENPLKTQNFSDEHLLDFLENMVVNVRKPNRFGSQDVFWYSPAKGNEQHTLRQVLSEYLRNAQARSYQ